jgi:ribosome assembly protein YihI (activator of Der GTPase)
MPDIKQDLYALYTQKQDKPRTMQEWHQALLHCSYDRIREISKATRGCKISNPEAKEEDNPCLTCIKAKSKKNISREAQRRAYKPWEYVHLDAVGKLYPTGIDGKEWQINSTDDCTRLIKGTTVVEKKGAQAYLKELFRYVKVQYDINIKTVRIDQGYEFGGKALEDFCKLNGATLEETDPYSAYQNGVSEATNKRINDGIRAATIQYDVPEELWPLLHEGVIHILNRMTTRGLLAITPFEAVNRSLNGMEQAQPQIDHLQPLGCRAYVHIEKEQRVTSHKFESRVDIGTLVGFAGHRQYKVYIPRRKQVITTSSCKFDTRPPAYWMDATSQQEALRGEIEQLAKHLANQDLPIQPAEESNDGGPDQMELDLLDMIQQEKQRAKNTATAANTGTRSGPPLDPDPQNTEKKQRAKNTATAANTGTRSGPPLDPDPQNTEKDTIMVDHPIEKAEAQLQHDTHREIRNARARSRYRVKKKNGGAPSERHLKKIQTRANQSQGAKTADFTSMPENLPRLTRYAARTRREKEVEAEAQSEHAFLTLLAAKELIPEGLEGAPLDNFVRNVQAFMTKVKADGREPTTYRRAISSPNSPKWNDAMIRELNSLEENHTWDIVQRPEGKKVVSGRWAYKIKCDENGDITKYKARWVIKGYEQREGIDYDQTFAGVAKGITIKALFALAAQYDLEIEQMDVVTAFLNGDIDTEMYTEYPEGFADRLPPGSCCRLRKSIYGLKQSPRLWQNKLRLALYKFGYRPLMADHCLYRNPSNGVIICTYVDDFLIIAPNMKDINVVKKQLNDTFKMEDLGACKYFLGMRVTRDRANGRLNLCQDAYIDKVMATFQIDEADVINHTAPMSDAALVDLIKYTGKALQQDITRYQQAIGCIMYAMLQTRPDLAFSVSKLSRFSSNPSSSHWKYVLQTLKYLGATKTLGITYTRNESGKLEFHGFSDSDHAGCKETGKSTTGYVFMMADGPVSWRSRRQGPVGLSSMEAEYYALTEAAREATWLRALLQELSYNKSDVHPTRIFGDNKPSHTLAKNPEFHQRSKHIAVQYHYIRNEVLAGNVVIFYIHTRWMVADGLTKFLKNMEFQRSVELLRLDEWNEDWVEADEGLGETELQEQQGEYVAWKMSLPPPSTKTLLDENNATFSVLEKIVMMDDSEIQE